MPVVRVSTVPNARTEENPSDLYTLTPERIRHLPEEEVSAKRLAAARGARFRELYALLDLRVAVHENGDLDVTVGTTNTKEVMSWNEPGSRFVPTRSGSFPGRR